MLQIVRSANNRERDQWKREIEREQDHMTKWQQLITINWWPYTYTGCGQIVRQKRHIRIDDSKRESDLLVQSFNWNWN